MQQPKRFQAPTLAEAYDQVRRELGESAVILSTRKAFAPGLFGQPGRQFVEVVARVPRPAGAEPSDGPEQRPALHQDQAAHDLVRAVAEATAAAPLSEGRVHTTQMPASGGRTAAGRNPARRTPVRPQAEGPFAGFQRVAAPADLPAASSEVAAPPFLPVDAPVMELPGDGSWSRQLDQMRSMLEQLMADRMDARIESGPDALRMMRDRLQRHGLSAAATAALLGEIDRAAARDESTLTAAVERRLAAKLPPVASVQPNRRRALFLVGPAGAGKTTMAVRLALELQRQHGLHVVIAGTDVNRAGAPQQLTAYGTVTGLDTRLCYAPDELEAILAEPGVDLVIVDTVGHSGLRRDRMAELSAFLQVARQRTVLLVLPATMKASDLSETVAAYSAVSLDGMVLTRCDETAHVGQAAGVAMDAAIGFAYTTHSEQVSDAPAIADNLSLAAAVVRAEWPSPVASPAPVRPSARRPLAKVG